jgi:hypothetical protein
MNCVTWGILRKEKEQKARKQKSGLIRGGIAVGGPKKMRKIAEKLRKIVEKLRKNCGKLRFLLRKIAIGTCKKFDFSDGGQGKGCQKITSPKEKKNISHIWGNFNNFWKNMDV